MNTEKETRMERLLLVQPLPEHEAKVLEYKQEFESTGDVMHGSAGLSQMESYSAWLEKLSRNGNPMTVEEGKVPSTTFLAMTKEDGQIVGMMDMRHALNEHLLQFGGHIGYSIRPSERLKGYATEMLGLGVKVARERGIEKILVTCDRDNTGSYKTILNNGGVMENELVDNGVYVRRCWIPVT